MTDEPEPGVIGALPRTRPHRRSDKRPAPPVGAPPVDPQGQAPVLAAAAPKARAAKKPAARGPAAKKPAARGPAGKKPAANAPPAKKPAITRPAAKPVTGSPRPSAATPETPSPREPSPGVLETMIQAAAELAEIGLHAGARALRRAVSRLPRP